MWDSIVKSFQLGDLQVQEVWKQLADEIGALYISTEDYNLTEMSHFSKAYSTDYGVVIHKVRGWAITLDSYRTVRDSGYRASGKIIVLMKAPISTRAGFRFAVYPKTFLSSAGKLVGMQDIEVGNAGFDRDYIIKGTDEEKVRALLASEKLRQMFRSSKEVNLSIRGCEAEGPTTLFGMSDQLYWSRRGWGSVTKDKRLLKLLFELFEEALDQLYSIGCIGAAQ
jgi:hypothetical protein